MQASMNQPKSLDSIFLVPIYFFSFCKGAFKPTRTNLVASTKSFSKTKNKKQKNQQEQKLNMRIIVVENMCINKT